MPLDHRNAYAGDRDLQGIVPHDLAGFVDHFHFFKRKPVVDKFVDLRNRVEGDLMLDRQAADGKHLRIGRFSFQNGFGLFQCFSDSRQAGSGNGLVR